ncbi:MAG: DNA repair protein RecO [Oscillospiraceae bacterium]|jgi:DNA repair protein RecO (recombination protein O)|nr:DNA repair protein RecO [Oscillospiraceae bacterium]
MLITVDGLVIAGRNAGDSSRYIDVLTKEYGVIEVLARGVKKITGHNAQSVAIFTYAAFCLNKRELSYTLNSARVKYSFHGLSADIRALSLAAYFSEAVKYTSASEQHGGNALRITLMALYELEKGQSRALIKAAFELRLSAELGVAPRLASCAGCAGNAGENENMYLCVGDGVMLCEKCRGKTAEKVFALTPGVLKAARYALGSPLARLYKFSASRDVSRGLSVVAQEYFLYHLGRGFKTLEYYGNLRRFDVQPP